MEDGHGGGHLPRWSEGAARSVGLGSPREACAKRPLVASWGLGPRVRRAVRCSCDSAKRAGVQRGGGERHWEVRVTSLGWKGARPWALSRLGGHWAAIGPFSKCQPASCCAWNAAQAQSCALCRADPGPYNIGPCRTWARPKKMGHALG